MQPPAKDSTRLTDKESAEAKELEPSTSPGDREEKDQRLLVLLGEVIRMSQEWVRALEAGDPFTADKYEAKCIAAMERFEANRKKEQRRLESFEQTQ